MGSIGHVKISRRLGEDQMCQLAEVADVAAFLQFTALKNHVLIKSLTPMGVNVLILFTAR